MWHVFLWVQFMIIIEGNNLGIPVRYTNLLYISDPETLNTLLEKRKESHDDFYKFYNVLSHPKQSSEYRKTCPIDYSFKPKTGSKLFLNNINGNLGHPYANIIPCHILPRFQRESKLAPYHVPHPLLLRHRTGRLPSGFINKKCDQFDQPVINHNNPYWRGERNVQLPYHYYTFLHPKNLYNTYSITQRPRNKRFSFHYSLPHSIPYNGEFLSQNVYRPGSSMGFLAPSNLVIGKTKRQANMYNPLQYGMEIPSSNMYHSMYSSPFLNYYYPSLKNEYVPLYAHRAPDYFSNGIVNKYRSHGIGEIGESITNVNKRAFIEDPKYNISYPSGFDNYDDVDPIDFENNVNDEEADDEYVTDQYFTTENSDFTSKIPVTRKHKKYHSKKPKSESKEKMQRRLGCHKKHKVVIYEVKTGINPTNITGFNSGSAGSLDYASDIQCSTTYTPNASYTWLTSAGMEPSITTPERKMSAKVAGGFSMFKPTKKNPGQKAKKLQVSKIADTTHDPLCTHSSLSTTSMSPEALKNNCELKYKKKCICSVTSLTLELNHIVQNTKSRGELMNKIKFFRCPTFVPVVELYEISPNLKPRVTVKKKRELQVGTPSGPKEIVTETLQTLINRQVPSKGESYYAFPSTTVEMPCMPTPDLKLSTNLADSVKYKWTHSNKKAITEGRMEEDYKHKGTLVINGVTLSDGDNYTCTASYIDPDTGNKTKRTFIHSVSVVDLPIVALHTNIHYLSNVSCEPEILEMFELYLPQQIEHVICDSQDGPPATVTEIFNPVCRKRLKKYDQQQASFLKNLGILLNKHTQFDENEDMVLSLNYQVELHDLWQSIPSTLDTDKCGPYCRQKILFKVIEILRQSTLDAILLPVFTVRAHLGRFQPELSSINIKILIACKGGLYLFEGFCVPCPAGKYSVEGSTQCLQCPPSTYQDQVASKSCIPCPHIFHHGCFNRRTFMAYFVPIILIIGLILGGVLYYKKRRGKRKPKKKDKKSKGAKKVLFVKKKGGHLKAVLDEGPDEKGTHAKTKKPTMGNSSSDDTWEEKDKTFTTEKWKPTPVAMDITSDKETPPK